MDNILLLEGDQGVGKSEVFKTLARAPGASTYYEESISNLDGKEIHSMMSGVWIGEIAEMAAYSKKAAAEWKEFVSRQEDNHRTMFSTGKTVSPRRFVFGATINPDGAGYLNDPTGARRIWPVTVNDIDIASLRRDVDLLWGEAVHAYRAGEQWHLTREEEAQARVEQAERLQDDALTARVVDVLATAEFNHCVEIVPYRLMEALGYDAKAQTKSMTRELNVIMAKMGWVTRQVRRSGKPIRVYQQGA